MFSPKNIRVLLVLLAVQGTGFLFGMKTALHLAAGVDCMPAGGVVIPEQQSVFKKLLACRCTSPSICMTEYAKQAEEAWLIAQELSKPFSASMMVNKLMACDQRESIHYMPVYELLMERVHRMIINYFDKSRSLPANSDMLWHIIVAELRNPGCRSFFHGARGRLRVLLDLQKKLAQEHGIEVPDHFEFLRAPGSRPQLNGITVSEYVKRWPLLPTFWGRASKFLLELLNPNIKIARDHFDPWRTELLSVDRSLFYSNFLLSDNRSFGVFFDTYAWFTRLLAGYGLPMPYDDQTFDRMHPAVSHGLLMHILLSDASADGLVYQAQCFGRPSVDWHLPNRAHESGDNEDQEYRIILDPSVFDQPNDNVQMYIYSKLR